MLNAEANEEDKGGWSQLSHDKGKRDKTTKDTKGKDKVDTKVVEYQKQMTQTRNR